MQARAFVTNFNKLSLIQRHVGYTVMLKSEAVGSDSCQPIRSDQYTPCKIPYSHVCTTERNKNSLA